jgi:hypothetical protein
MDLKQEVSQLDCARRPNITAPYLGSDLSQVIILLSLPSLFPNNVFNPFKKLAEGYLLFQLTYRSMKVRSYSIPKQPLTC